MDTKNEAERQVRSIVEHIVSGRTNQPASTAGLRAAKAVARDEGISAITVWRRVRAGLLTSVNIAGRPYITKESLAEFYRRAAAGEFAQDPVGAAAASHKIRKDKEQAGLE